MTRKSDSKSHTLASIVILGQAPRNHSYRRRPPASSPLSAGLPTVAFCAHFRHLASDSWSDTHINVNPSYFHYMVSEVWRVASAVSCAYLPAIPLLGDDTYSKKSEYLPRMRPTGWPTSLYTFALSQRVLRTWLAFSRCLVRRPDAVTAP